MNFDPAEISLILKTKWIVLEYKKAKTAHHKQNVQMYNIFNVKSKCSVED